MRRVMVDMSATVLHHGHIRLLRHAKELGYVIVALTTDDEVEATKGFRPILNFDQRREIIEAVRFVDEVVPCPWLITEDFLDAHQAEILVHGDDNQNPISPSRLVLVPRTVGISSSVLRSDGTSTR